MLLPARVCVVVVLRVWGSQLDGGLKSGFSLKLASSTSELVVVVVVVVVELG